MADKKITQLTELTTIADDDFLAVVDTSATVTKKIRKDNLFAGFLPTGAIMMYSHSSEPTGWLFCNGQAVSRTTYAALFALIGETYGDGDGSTTFNLPDLSGRVPVGRDTGDSQFDTLGEVGGEKNHTLTLDEIPSHNHGASQSPHSHGVNDPGHSHSAQGTWIRDVGSGGSNTNTGSGTTWRNLQTIPINGSGTGISIQGANANITISSQGGGQAHNNLQPYLVLNFMIKT